MKKYLIIFAPALIVVAFALVPRKTKSVSPVFTADDKHETESALIRRGEYLVTMIGCNDCHSPKIMGSDGPAIDSTLLLSGYPENKPVPLFPTSLVRKGQIILSEGGTLAMGPWGTSFAANLTSDDTGIGNWTEEQFKNALRHGKFKGLNGSRTLAPLMPWQNFTQMTDEDCEAIFHYLQSTPSVKNIVPALRPAPKDL